MLQLGRSLKIVLVDSGLVNVTSYRSFAGPHNNWVNKILPKGSKYHGVKILPTEAQTTIFVTEISAISSSSVK